MVLWLFKFIDYIDILSHIAISWDSYVEYTFSTFKNSFVYLYCVNKDKSQMLSLDICP